MIKIMFVCHGNICRSTMAEAIARDIIQRENLDMAVASTATSTEEIGNLPDRRTMRTLDENGYDSRDLLKFKVAKQLKSSDYDAWDYFFVMDDNNLRNVSRIFLDKDKKVYKIFEFAKGEDRNIADPWYTGEFNITFEELQENIKIILEKLSKKVS